MQMLIQEKWTVLLATNSVMNMLNSPKPRGVLTGIDFILADNDPVDTVKVTVLVAQTWFGAIWLSDALSVTVHGSGVRFYSSPYSQNESELVSSLSF
ncbi:MAG: hypothetical protein ACK5ME_07740 [Parahaliea sp.]